MLAGSNSLRVYCFGRRNLFQFAFQSLFRTPQIVVLLHPEPERRTIAYKPADS